MFNKELISYTKRVTSLIKRHGSKMMALLFWFTVVASYWLIANHYNLPPEVMVKQFGHLLVNSVFGPLLFILFFTLQPLIFFPSALMAVLGGCLYGPVAGFFVSVVGANGAGLTSYTVGRFFGQGMLENQEQNDGLISRYTNYVRTNSFEAILVMHLIFLPYDLVNYLAGFLRVDWKSFLLATALGSLPGTLTFVLFGASIKGDIMSGAPEINLSTLAISGVTLMISLGLSQLLKQRQKHLNKTLANTI